MTSVEPLYLLTQEATDVLVRELGLARTLRFLGQFRTGTGDYTRDREAFLPEAPLDELLAEMKRLDDLRAD